MGKVIVKNDEFADAILERRLDIFFNVATVVFPQWTCDPFDCCVSCCSFLFP